MTEYWVSQARRFCTYCQCWTADNKASIQFHEKGKRHIDNVNKKINELKKKGHEDAIARDEVQNAMSAMEKAALEAFKKDLQGNPNLALHYGVKPQVEGPSLPPPEQEASEETKAEQETSEETKADDSPAVEWHEAKSPDGYSYYWNVNTKETSWNKPDQYKSLKEQKAERKAKKDKSNVDPVVTNAENTAPKTKIVHTAQSKFVLHKKSPKISSQHDSAVSTHQTNDIPPQSAGLSQWVAVEPVNPDPPVDLDLPVADTTRDVVLPVFTDETQKRPKFEEKTVASLGKRDDVVFKKRKIASGSRHTRRQETDSND